MLRTLVLVSISVILLTFSLMESVEACPRIVSRAGWGARKATTSPLTTNPPTHVVIHHSASASCTTQAACSAQVRSFQNQHMDVNKWADIGYNFLVGEDGNVYEGRGWGKTGAHAPNFNSRSIGICVIGTYTNRLPNAQALKAVKDLIACGVSKKTIRSDYKLLGHRQAVATQCPGNALYNEITKWPRWTAKP